jgi:uridine phosphorylase
MPHFHFAFHFKCSISLQVSVVPSARGFVTHTGKFNGVPVSIVATGMGIAMADFVAREVLIRSI